MNPRKRRIKECGDLVCIRSATPAIRLRGSSGPTGRVAGETCLRRLVQMNAVEVGGCNANWAWGLVLIVLNVVIHVIGLALIYERVLHVLSGAMEHRRFMPRFVVVIGVAALLATLLHDIEVANWGTTYRILAALPAIKSAVVYSLSAMTSYGQANLFLEGQRRLMGALEALNGMLRSVRHDSEGLAAEKQRAAPASLGQDFPSWKFTRVRINPSDSGIVKYKKLFFCSYGRFSKNAFANGSNSGAAYDPSPAQEHGDLLALALFSPLAHFHDVLVTPPRV